MLLINSDKIKHTPKSHRYQLHIEWYHFDNLYRNKVSLY